MAKYRSPLEVFSQEKQKSSEQPKTMSILATLMVKVFTLTTGSSSSLFVETVTWLNCKFGQCLSMQYCNLLDKHVISSNSEPPKDQFLHCQQNFSRHSLWLVRVLPHKENGSILVSTSLYNCVHKCHSDFLRQDFSWAITSACLLHEKIAST